MITDLTVCITNFKRATYLERAIKSVLMAGFKRISVATSEPDKEVLAVLERYRSHPDLEFNEVVLDYDCGCNRTWEHAVYRAKTDHVLVLHDDDLLGEELGEAYVNTIQPAMNEGAGFATWRAHLYFDDGTIRPTEWFHGPTRTTSSDELRAFMLKPRRLSLSPIISVFRRATLLSALKEAERYLTPNPACLYHPGMLLGTEIMAYLRHCEDHKSWFYLDQVLSYYGACESSGTVQAQKSGDLTVLFKGYDVARAHFSSGASKSARFDSRVIFLYDNMPARSDDEARRFDYAMKTWRLHFNHGTLLEFPVTTSTFSRSSSDMGDASPAPFVVDVLDYGCHFARPEDVVVYCNRDIALTTTAPSRILSHASHHGISIGLRRAMTPNPNHYYHSVMNCKRDGGVDMVAVRPDWWKTHRSKYPDMLIGREGWDWVMRRLAEELVGKNAYLDDCLIHEPHDSWWRTVRQTNPGQLHNRRLARKFFVDRKDLKAVRSLL